MIDRLMGILKLLARIEITIALALMAGALAIWNAESGGGNGIWIVAPLSGLVVNLCAALVSNRTLSAQPALFAFHVGLAGLAIAVAVDALTSFTGHVEVTENSLFDPNMVVGVARPFHNSRLERIRFRQKSFEIKYAPGMSRRDTRSLIEIPEGNSWREIEIGDDTPLVFSPYRLYTSFNKGFAPIVTYVDAQGASYTGAVHLPSYPLNEDRQGNVWIPPGSDEPLTLWLPLEEPLYNVDAEWRFSLPENPSLVVIEQGLRRELRPGESIQLAEGGVLRFESLETWMGYTVTANPYVSLIVATALASLASLLWHISKKLLAPLGAQASSTSRGESGYV